MKLLNSVICTPKNMPVPATATAKRAKFRFQSANGFLISAPCDKLY
jgi:hypothetical protein